MTRTTRSSAVAERHDGEQENSNKSVGLTTTKKRKRASNPTADSQDQPDAKQPRTDEPQQHKIPSVGDLPLNCHHALKILDILALIDTQGLLDRLVPLPSNDSPNSLRSLLRDASQHSLSLLRSAVHHLRPGSSRSRNSEQQLQFYSLALSLLERASFHNAQLPDDIESILPQDADSARDDVALSRAEPKFALVQHLPQGDYWTSLSTENVDSSLPTGHAELVSIIPYPSSSSSAIPRLSTLHRAVSEKKQKLPEPRIFHRGTVLDYGPWTSFAPTFDQEAADIGQRQLSEFYYHRELKRRKREEERRQDHEVVEVEDVVMQDAAPDQAIPIDPELDGLLPSDQLSGIKDALSSLELENSIQELLDKNQRALARLQELQFLRLTASEGKLSVVEEGSEEWETANAILESLTLLASLRPRPSQEDSSPLVPPPSVLHTLHQTLPLFDLHGWSGTLPSGRVAALRDDSTVKVRAGSGTQAIATPAPTPATVAPSLAVPFAGYYGTPAGQYRPVTATNQYASQAKPYYASYAGQQGNYYGGQGYPGVGATGQQPYSTFTGWFGNYTAAMAASASGTASGRGTPQPAAAMSPYGGYFATNATPQKPPVVANTVVAKQWSAGLYPQGVVPTLPAHVRSNSLQNGQQ